MSVAREEIAAAYADHERRIAIGRIRIGCLLAMILLPLGAIVDTWMYHAQAPQFLLIRSVWAALMVPFLLLVNTPFGARRYKELAVLLAMIPAAGMSTIIYLAPVEGATSPYLGAAASPYYAGLNLVLLAIGLVLQWDLRQSVVAVLLVLGLYVVVSTSSLNADTSRFFVNNLWFLLLTGIIVVTGNHIQSRLRQRDFASSYQLEQSRKELEVTNQRLRELDEIKGRFFANISHELRTPLTLLLGHLESIRTHPVLTDPRLREQLDTMHGNGMRLLKLINDLLDLVRLDAGHLKLQPVPVPVESFLRGVLNSIRRFAEDRGLRIGCEVHPDLNYVLADPDKLEKVFLNLLFNSIKFTSAGGSIRIVAFREADQAVFEVIDTGVGIAPEHLPHLFSRFWQADTSAQRKFQGAGIGTALVKELAEAHGGTVEVRSQVGVGTTIIVRLPTATPPAALPDAPPVSVPAEPTPPGTDPGKPPVADKDAWLASLYRRAELYASLTPLREALRPVWTPATSGTRPRVLIADDEPDMLRFLRLHLEDDYDVVEAVDGDQAVTMAKQYLPDVILCDMMMPEKDGLQVCRELRQHQGTRPIPFLMLTARADDETKMQALAVGVTDFLPKPFSTAELRVRMKNLAEAYQLQRTLARQNQKLEATIEQLKETELQLVQSEKMASLGRMSAGIIHEINNPLNFTRTGLFTLRRFSRDITETDRPEFEEILHDIEEGVTRVAGIVSDLRSFTHPSGGASEEVDVGDSADSALRFLAAEWRDRVQVQNEIPEGFRVRAARSKLIQVFVNLLQNSLDALREHPPASAAPTIRLHTEERNGSRVVSIWDNGPGIPEHHLAKIFDPFFTTKDVGQGTGLGLSIVYRILREFGGRISVRTEVDQFSEFSLEFPRTVTETKPAKPGT